MLVSLFTKSERVILPYEPAVFFVANLILSYILDSVNISAGLGFLPVLFNIYMHV